MGRTDFYLIQLKLGVIGTDLADILCTAGLHRKFAAAW